MEISPDLAGTIIWELRFIRWLLIFLVLIGAGFLLFLMAVFRGVGGLGHALKREQFNKERQTDIEALLSQGSAKAAKFSSLEWVAAQPKQPYAHWLLGRAHYQLGELIHAKKSFQAVVSLSPDWESTVQPWLEKVDAEIKSGPRIVE
jgi:hypothetical protein